MNYEHDNDYCPDCDPADCNYTAPTEFATDNITETTSTTPDDFMPTPEEYIPSEYFETSADNDPSDEQAATYDSFSNFDGAYGTNDSEDYDAEDAVEYDYETATDNSSVYDETENYYAETSDELDYDITESRDPSDEQAATVDEWYTTAKNSHNTASHTTVAQERCELDDYEIISDVLGSEKQLVKLYSTALCEASEEHFRNLIKENLDDAASDQYKAFEFMQKRGMYPTEQASDQDISQAKQQFTPLCRNNNCNSAQDCCYNDVGTSNQTCGGTDGCKI